MIHSATAPISTIGMLTSCGTVATAAVAPSTVPATRYAALERVAPVSGCETKYTVAMAQYGRGRPSASAI
ncbi:hypothetical protein D9M72_606580 [compost metagenome]